MYGYFMNDKRFAKADYRNVNALQKALALILHFFVMKTI